MESHGAAEEYFAKHDIEGELQKLVTQLASEQPEDPMQWLSAKLGKAASSGAKKGREKARLNAGTAHTFAGGKIGQAFTRTKNPDYVNQRIAIFDRLMETQKANIALKEQTAIKITLEDQGGAVVEGAAWKTLPIDIAKGIDGDLAKNAIVCRIVYEGDISPALAAADAMDDSESEDEEEGQLWDLLRPIEGDCSIRFYTFEDKEGQSVFWHSSAHILGQVLEQEVGSQLTVGPPIELGPKGSFFYDCYMGSEAITGSDYKGFEAAANKVIKGKQRFERLVLTKDEALELFQDNPFKMVTIRSKVPDGGLTSAYRNGNLIDLCLGPHVPSTDKIKAFEITSHAAAYYAGDEKNDSLQRIYAVSFPDKTSMKEHKARMKLLADYDHRKVGQEQELFFFHELSPGSCMFLPHGAAIYNTLCEFIRDQLWKRGYTEVVSPNIYNTDLWKTSGHWEHYQENMFSFFDNDDTQFALKPMNCPGHCLMFSHRVRSYRELPMRFADFGTLHRNEKSGALTGLTRVRRFQQDDGHIFCRMDQVQAEVEGALDFMKFVYNVFGMKYTLDLSTRPKKACGLETAAGVERWDKAEAALKDALDSFTSGGNDEGNKKPGAWRYNRGDGAFYGPKIDIKVYDIVGRAHQCATIQLDFQLPVSFDLKFKSSGEVSKDDKKNETDRSDLQENEKRLPPGFERPVIVHRAMLGSVERMMAVLTEHFQGKWPFWLSPRQIQIVPVHQEHYPYCQHVAKTLREAGFHADADCGEDTMNQKVRKGQLAQYNFILVCGEEEMTKRGVNVRTRSNKRLGEGNTWAKGYMSLDDAIAFFQQIKSDHENDPIIPDKAPGKK
jgi:threonyl-tRNA synthetase